QRLGPAFELETIDQTSFLAYNFIRLSELVDIDLEFVREMGGITEYFDKYNPKKKDRSKNITMEQYAQWKTSLP
ncbi:MAG: hypothetical protein AAGC99_22380, partial [Pseudomonadota bacterium]